MFHPRTDVALVDRHGLLIVILAVPGSHPSAVRPFKLADVKGFGCIARAHLRIVGKGIRLVKLLARRRPNQIFVKLVLAHIRNKKFIDAAGTQLLHLMLFLVPAVKSADHPDPRRTGRPHSEKHALLAVFHGRVRSQLFIDIIMRSLRKHILVGLGDKYLLCGLLLHFPGRRLLLFSLLFLHSC